MMNIEQLIHNLRARINPQYYDQIGTESYERHQVVKALEYLAMENERLKELMAKRAREHQQEMTSFRLRVRSQDDATFAALREENERLRGWIRVEGGCNNTCTRQILGEVCHGRECGKTLPEPAP